MERHYLYRHIRLDKDEPFYIGIGTKNKDDLLYNTYTRSSCFGHRSSLWKNIASKSEISVEIMLESDDYKFIKQREQEFIALYGRINRKTGCLANLTDGGEGVLGIVFSEETKDKMSKTRKGRRLSPESQAKRVATLKRKYALNPPICTEEQKERLRQYQTGRKQSPETIAKRALSLTGKSRNFSVEGLKRLKKATSRPVIDIVTNKIYNSIVEAAESIGMKSTSLRAKLCGQNINNTVFRYLENFQ